jgi:hypothetical protein
VPALALLAAELLGEGPAGPKDQRLHGGDGHVEVTRDVGVRVALPLAEQEGATLHLRQPRERVLEADQPAVVRVVGAAGERLEILRVPHELDGLATAGCAMARQADVLGDRQQPGGLVDRHHATLECAVGLHERGLGGVLGLLPVPEQLQAVAEDARRVPLVQPLGRSCLEPRCGWLGDAHSGQG